MCPVRSICICVRDEDKKVLNVIGRISDDRPLTDKVSAAQDTGRRVFCGEAGLAEWSRDKVIEHCIKEFGFEYTDARIV